MLSRMACTTTRMTSAILVLVSSLIGSSLATSIQSDLIERKVCWSSCGQQNAIQSVEVEGCQRRSTFPHSEQFRCEALAGPPCTVRHGDTVDLSIVFNHTGIAEGALLQTAGATAKSGILSWMESPWATLDARGCNFIQKSEELVGCTGEAGTSLLKLPIYIEDFFPPNTYFVRYYLTVESQQIACLAFNLRICNYDKCL